MSDEKLKLVFGLALSEDEILPLSAILRSQGFGLVGSMVATPLPLARMAAEASWANIQHCTAYYRPLMRGNWVEGVEDAAQVMAAPPPGLRDWHLRSLLWTAATSGFVFMLDRLASTSLDLTMHLTAARIVGHRTVGIIPSELRTTLDTAQLTMVDTLVGEADGRSLSVLLPSLTLEPPPNAEGVAEG